jgi:hypothetical protein
LKHVQTNQKKHQILNMISQNQEFIYVLPFETMTILGKLFIFPSYECQKTQIKNLFDSDLSFGFNLKYLKMDTYCVKSKQVCKGLSKGLI